MDWPSEFSEPAEARATGKKENWRRGIRTAAEPTTETLRCAWFMLWMSELEQET
jgi:hypothetical protein